MFFEFVNGIIVVTEQGLLNRHIKKFYESDNTPNKSKFQKLADYIYSVYDKRSIYMKMSERDRRKLVCDDLIGQSDYHQAVESNLEFQLIKASLNQMQFTHKERLLHECKIKIDEYIDFFHTLKIDAKNQKEYKDMIKGSKELLDLYDDLEVKVNKEILTKQMGGGESKLFEDEG